MHRHKRKRRPATLAWALVVILFWASVLCAQTTSFTYQGRLTDGGNAANGGYDLQFALFDGSSGGTQIGSTLTRSAVAVSSGVFSISLDFGVNAFPGADRFLEIGVRLAGGGTFITLSPRQQISSTPYAIRTLSATTADALSSACAACVQDSQINSVTGSKVSGSIPVTSVPSGSASYIQNTGSQQASANFNISGSGTLGGNLLTSGRVGVGTTSPISKFHIVSGSGDLPPRLQSTGSANFATSFAAGWDFYHGTIGKGYVGVPDAQSDLAPGELLLFGGPGTMTSLWAGSNRSVTLDTNGNVGIGTTTPAHRLSLIGGPTWTSNLFTGALELENAAAIGWQADPGGQRFGIAPATGGLYFFHTTSNPGTTGSPANFDFEIADGGELHAYGNAQQARDKGGFVKAMLVVNADGTIARCYNGITNSSSGNCGFTIGHPFIGSYEIEFGFHVGDRFASVTPHYGFNSEANVSAMIYEYSGSVISIVVFYTDDRTINGYTNDPFTIIVY